MVKEKMIETYLSLNSVDGNKVVHAKNLNITVLVLRAFNGVYLGTLSWLLPGGSLVQATAAAEACTETYNSYEKSAANHALLPERVEFFNTEADEFGDSEEYAVIDYLSHSGKEYTFVLFQDEMIVIYPEDSYVSEKIRKIVGE